MWETAFDVSMLIEPKVIVSCPRFELVEDFMNLLADSGIRWCGLDQDIPSKDNSNWEGYMGSTCYWIDDEGLAYASMDYAEEIKLHGDTGGYASSCASLYRGNIGMEAE